MSVLQASLEKARATEADVQSLREDVERLRRDLGARTNELHTCRKIIGSMAVCKFGALKKETRRNAVKKIVDATVAAGFDVSDDTVRRHLKAALADIPDESRKLLED